MEVADSEYDKNSFNIMRASMTEFHVQEMPIKHKIDNLIETAMQCSESIQQNQKQILMLRSEFGTAEHIHNDDTRYISECAINDIYKLNKEVKSVIPPDIEDTEKISVQIEEEVVSNRKLQEEIYILTNRIKEVETELGVISNDTF